MIEICTVTITSLFKNQAVHIGGLLKQLNMTHIYVCFWTTASSDQSNYNNITGGSQVEQHEEQQVCPHHIIYSSVMPRNGSITLKNVNTDA